MPTETNQDYYKRISAQALAAGSTGVVPSPQLPDSLSSTSLSGTPSLTIPPAPVPSNPAPSADASLEALLSAYSAPSAEENTAGDLQTRILDTLGTLGTEKTRKTQLEAEAGLPGQRTELQNVINQLQTLAKERAAIPLQIQEDSQGRGRTAAGVAPLEAGQVRQNAIKSLGLAAIGQTLQGNITLAESTIQSALDAEFEPERQKLETLKQLYEFNKDALERVDKKKSDALNIFLKERERILNDQKDDKSAASGLALAAIKNFPSDPKAQRAAQEVLALDPNGPDYLHKVLQLVGPYQQNPLELAQATADLEYKRALTRKAILDAQPGGGGGGGGEQLYGGLSSATATAVRSKVGKFSSEPMVQNFATIQDGYNFASSINSQTTNPADDQALIYALAKALDPGSVVREGEYATAQKYTQSWAQAYGKGIENAILGTGFLSETARNNIKQTIKQKYESSKRSYDNLYQSYTTGINNLTGRDDGTRFLEDYYIAPTDVVRNVDQFASLRDQLQPGEVLVLRNGQPYAIQREEFDLRTDRLPPAPMNTLNQ